MNKFISTVALASTGLAALLSFTLFHVHSELVKLRGAYDTLAHAASRDQVGSNILTAGGADFFKECEVIEATPVIYRCR